MSLLPSPEGLQSQRVSESQSLGSPPHPPRQATPRPRMPRAGSNPSLAVPKVRTLTSVSPCMNRDRGPDAWCCGDPRRECEKRPCSAWTLTSTPPHPRLLCALPVLLPCQDLRPLWGPRRARTGTGVRGEDPHGQEAGHPPVPASPCSLPSPTPPPHPVSDARVSLGGKRHEPIQEPEAGRSRPPNG